MIQVRDLTKVYPTRFGEKQVLDGISFDLAMGERLGILGRNGAGKSTLIRLISGAELPTSGTIETGMSVSWPLAFGGAFQPNLTGLDNVRFISRIYDQDAEKNLEFVEEFAELGPYLREEVRSYSSGMRARLAFAISMIIEFDCFLIDEVSAVGDARFHDRCNRELFRKRGDRAMVIISHDASYVRDHCNRFAVLHSGKLELFDKFEDAYSDFRQKIGLDASEQAEPIAIARTRRELIETTHSLAMLDDAFRVVVQQADWHRDDGQWEQAEAGYLSALELYPYQRSYWVQAGHMAKEQGAHSRAEIAYRTAMALGEAYADVREHFEFVVAAQGLKPADVPAHLYSGDAAKNSAVGVPDIDLLTKAFWGEALGDLDMQLTWLRECATCDELLSRILSKSADKAPDLPAGEDPAWLIRLMALAGPDLSVEQCEALIQSPDFQRQPARGLLAKGGFTDWEALREIPSHFFDNNKPPRDAN